MTPEEQVQGLLNAVGAISETLWAFYSSLLKQGFDEGQALMLTMMFMKRIVPGSGSDD